MSIAQVHVLAASVISLLSSHELISKTETEKTKCYRANKMDRLCAEALTCTEGMDITIRAQVAYLNNHLWKETESADSFVA